MTRLASAAALVVCACAIGALAQQAAPAVDPSKRVAPADVEVSARVAAP